MNIKQDEVNTKPSTFLSFHRIKSEKCGKVIAEPRELSEL